MNLDLANRLLAAAVESNTLQAFYQQALNTLTFENNVEGILLLSASLPNWEILALAGQTINHGVELGANALDQELPAWGSGVVAVSLTLGTAQINHLGQTASPKVILFAGEIALEKNKAFLLQTVSLFNNILQMVQTGMYTKRRMDRLEMLLDITNQWHQTEDMETLLNQMAVAATDLLGADRASIFLWDESNNSLIGRPALGMKDNKLRLKDNVGIVGDVFQTGKTVRVASPKSGSTFDKSVDSKTGYQTKTILCVPLISPTGERFGAFEVLNKLQGTFTDEDEQGLTELAAFAGVSLSNTQQWESLVERHTTIVEQAAGEIQFIGECPAVQALRSTTRKVADTDLAILILGENGTGKEVIAQSLHYQSKRRNEPFVAVNCAALTETLLESELFGHEKGAFTDAHDTRIGKFELASGGTLFLDEIGDMSLSGQAKLLRVLEDKTVVRVGGSMPIHTEVRILAATNQNLAERVREKRFREDLYFRLNVVCLELPPLRERGEDILLIAKAFLIKFCKTMGRRAPKFSAAANKRLLSHRWPGNVRELRNLMERLVYLTSNEKIEVDDLAFILSPGQEHERDWFGGDLTLTDATQEFQREYIQQSIKRHRGNVSEASRMLGVHRSNLYRKMRQLEMQSDEESF